MGMLVLKHILQKPVIIFSGNGIVPSPKFVRYNCLLKSSYTAMFIRLQYVIDVAEL